MLERPVRINGTTYTHHELTGVDHDFAREITTVRITSYNDTENHTTWVPLPLSENATRAELCETVYALPIFEPYINDDTDRVNQLMSVLTDEQLESFPTSFFSDWKAGIYYTVGTRVAYNGGLFRCLTAHTSQADWTPDVVPSLWTGVRAMEVIPDAIEEWVQPDSTNGYMSGDKVLHFGDTWVSLIDNNVWEPGVVGTENLWWIVTDTTNDETGDTTSSDDSGESGDSGDTGDITGSDDTGDTGDGNTTEPTVETPTEPDDTDDIYASVPEWVQPNGSNPYGIGDVVQHNGQVWESATSGNVWEPGVYGWNVISQ